LEAITISGSTDRLSISVAFNLEHCLIAFSGLKLQFLQPELQHFTTFVNIWA